MMANSIQNHAASFRIGLWPVPGYAMMSCASVFEPLRAANHLADMPLFETVVFADGHGAESSSGALLPGSHAVGETPPLDLFLVIAGGDPFAFDDQAALAWLRTLSARVPTLGGVSGGPVILTQAGLMTGRRFTVHWDHAEELVRRHPTITVKRRLYVMERDRVTCGGGNAPLDLMHAIIARRHGSAFAREVSDWFLHTDVRAATARQRDQFSDDLEGGPPALQDAIAVMEDHLSDPLSLAQLGLISGVSPRQLTRLFTERFGTSPMAFYRQLRLDAARKLVLTTRMTVAEIADATGFHSAGHLSNQYLHAFGERPSAARIEGSFRDASEND
ncbi:MAG: GlxA family transcriptional regulator [Pseudomonadota bacterium]